MAHALEAATSYAVPHGSAVGVGMILEARLGEALGVTAPGVSERLAHVLRSMEIPERLPAGAAPGEVMSYLGADKKARAGEARVVLLERLGSVSKADDWSRPVPPDVIDQVLSAHGAI